MASGIYVISSPSGRVYIGSSKDLAKRKQQHFYKMRKGVHPCDALQKAFVKYEGHLKFITIEYCAINDLIEREQFWIDNSNFIWVSRIYNSSRIAGRPEHTEEVRRKISEKARNRPPVSEETKQKLSEAGKGRRHTEESLGKILAYGVIGQPASQELRQIMTRRRREVGFSPEGLEIMLQSKTGKKASPETRAKMSAAQKERYKSEEERLKAGNGSRGKSKSEETRKRMSEAAKNKPPVSDETRQKLREARARQLAAIAYG